MRLRIASGVLALVLGSGGAHAAQCTQTGVDLRGDWGQAHFNVEVADDVQELGKGLMFRESLPASAGMLFIYDTPRHARFWMKNTLIPLDMIFLDSAGRVLQVAQNAIPLDETPIDGGEGVLMILEINGGMAQGLGITVGSELRHPAFDSSIAAWPCMPE
jgi:uncharacterized membrane protein (UPF0127 family)